MAFFSTVSDFNFFSSFPIDLIGLHPDGFAQSC